MGDALTGEQEEALRDEVSLVDTGASTQVERGPLGESDSLALLLLVLGAGTLVLAGTFHGFVFLSLSLFPLPPLCS